MKRTELKRSKSLAPITYAEAVEKRSQAARRKQERALAQRVPPPKGRGREPAPLKRKKAPNPGNRPTPPLSENARCAVCKVPAVHHHHILYRQLLRREHGDATALANLIPLCEQHHADQHNRKEPISTWVLPTEAIRFAEDLLGPGAAFEYISRRYLAAGDHRLVLLNNKEQ